MIDPVKAEDELFGSILDALALAKRRELPVLRAGPKDCQSCGACCMTYEIIDVKRSDPNYRWLMDHDYINISEDGLPEMKRLPSDNRCIALTGEIGKSVGCSIYDHRPVGCKVYKAGEARCRSAIILEITKCYG